MRIGLVRETAPGERRVALTPEGVDRLIAAGHEVAVEAGAGGGARFDDDAYRRAGARVLPGIDDVFDWADVVAAVQMPAAFIEDGRPLPARTAGVVLVGLLRPMVDLDAVRRLKASEVTAFSLDLMPRLTRTQAMDVLSSMSTLAGYRAVILAAGELERLFPLLMTAAGTIRPARVLVLGAGVAGLQAIATARRLGAVVEAFDTRAAAREQVESLGARFLTLPLGEEGEGGGGYARALGAEAHRREQELLAGPVAAADAVITTALVPGARAPLLITAEMVASMRPGSVIVDLAAEAGGNVALTVPGQRVEAGGVTILGPLNLPASMPGQASQLYARNLVAFLLHLAGGPLQVTDGRATVDRDDEIVRHTLVTHAGQVVHEAVAARVAAGGD